MPSLHAPAPDLTLRAAALVAGGAALGGVARWLVGAALTRDFPYGVLVANVGGSFLLGAFTFGALDRGWFGPEARLVVAIGFLGAFTTMSSFAYDTVSFLESREYARAAANFVGNAVLSVLAVALGRAAALALAGGA